MKSWKTKSGFNIFQVLSGRSNAYLIKNYNIAVLVDTGRKSSFDTLLKNIDLLNIKIEDLSILILTHTHFDHCQSARLIKEKSDCKIIASSKAHESIKNGYAELPDGTFLLTKFIAILGRAIGKRKFGFDPFHEDVVITDEYMLNFADCSLKIIETEGHSIDSVSILVDDEIAIVGDAMFGVFKNFIIPPFADDTASMIKSWGKLLLTNCDLFLPGHGKEINRNLLLKEYQKYAQKYNLQ